MRDLSPTLCARCDVASSDQSTAATTSIDTPASIAPIENGYIPMAYECETVPGVGADAEKFWQNLITNALRHQNHSPSSSHNSALDIHPHRITLKRRGTRRRATRQQVER